jgi:hypothetical protein
MNKDLVIFDFEVFPEWWCIVYNVYPDSENPLYVITSDDDDYFGKLYDVTKLGYLCGFNIKGYDLQILDGILNGWTPGDLYDHSQSIINDSDGRWKSLSFWRKFEFTDLFDDLKTMGSLKQFESNTGLSIHESDIPFGKVGLTDTEKQSIIEYCKDDVRATNKLATARWGYLTAKANCSKLSALSEAECIKNTSAKVCAKMLGAKNMENYSEPVYKIPEPLVQIFTETIHPNIINQFVGQELTNDFNYEVNYMKNHIIYGAGGVHSTYKDSLWCKSNDEYTLVNADFENLYPSLLVNFDYFASGVPQEGRELFTYLLSECRRLKAHLRELKAAGKGNTEEYKELYALRDSIKLIMNASTGAMRQKFSPLFDPQNIISLCMTGQLLTTCMAKKIFNLGGLIIQMNTDGVLFRIPNNKLTEVKSILSEFSKQINIPLEVDEEFAVFQKDVNNYVLLPSATSTPKLKGRWAKKSGSDVPLTPLNAPVINNAVVNYYAKNIPIEETIHSCKNPLDFMMTTMKGPTYSAVTYDSSNGEKLTYNVNRVYASTRTDIGTLHKVKYDDIGNVIKRDKIASIPDHSQLWNSLVESEIPLDLDYNWYITAAKKNLVSMSIIE